MNGMFYIEKVAKTFENGYHQEITLDIRCLRVSETVAQRHTNICFCSQNQQNTTSTTPQNTLDIKKRLTTVAQNT